MPDKITNRTIEFDILKGLGMLMVIIGHSFHVWPLYEIVNSVHMPLFFFVSGYFFSVKGTMGGGISEEFKTAGLSLCFSFRHYLFVVPRFQGAWRSNCLRITPRDNIRQ